LSQLDCPTVKSTFQSIRWLAGVAGLQRTSGHSRLTKVGREKAPKKRQQADRVAHFPAIPALNFVRFLTAMAGRTIIPSASHFLNGKNGFLGPVIRKNEPPFRWDLYFGNQSRFNSKNRSKPKHCCSAWAARLPVGDYKIWALKLGPGAATFKAGGGTCQSLKNRAKGNQQLRLRLRRC
jgi:hypothetical protein